MRLSEFFKKGDILLLACCVVIITFVYLPILNGFFQQDEWLAFGNRFYFQQTSLKELISYAFSPSGGHYTPLNFLTIHFLFSLVKLNYSIYATISLFLHLITTCLVFWLSKVLLNDGRKAAIAAFIFGSAAASFQAVAWPVVDIGIHGASIFALISLIIFFNFLKYAQLKLFIYSLIFLGVSFLFKEIAVGIVLMMFFSIYLFGDKLSHKKKIYGLIVIIGGILYVMFRLVYLFSDNKIENSSLAQTSFVVYQTPRNIGYNFITFPIKGIVQTIIPPVLLIETAKNIPLRMPIATLSKLGTLNFAIFSQKIALEFINLVLFFVLLLSFVFCLKNRPNMLVAKVAIFGFLFIVFNSFIYALSPERSGAISLIDSRNLYFPSIGTAILLVACLTGWKKFRIVEYLFIVIFCTFNIIFLSQELKTLTDEGMMRKHILQEIITIAPKLPAKTVFYTQVNMSLYGLPEKELIMPFQSGFGQTLLVWYQAKENFPKSFFENKFLWAIADQGYKEVGSRGFGYFRNLDLLGKTVQNHNLPLSSIIGFDYDVRTDKLSNISLEVQGRIQGYLAKKQIIPITMFSLIGLQNSDDLKLALDGNRETFWDSKLPYNQPQSLIIKLANPKKIAQVQVDSYNNKDQNEVGYELLLSNDGKMWQKVFQMKRCPPDENGLVNLYFKPQFAKFLEIKQIGTHQFASWVIHELKIYETID